MQSFASQSKSRCCVRERLKPLKMFAGFLLAHKSAAAFNFASPSVYDLPLKSQGRCRHRHRTLLMLSSDDLKQQPPEVPAASPQVQSQGSAPPLSHEVAVSHALLMKYDEAHRAVGKSEGAIGLGGQITANEWASRVEREPLVSALRSICDAAMERKGRIMLGICAQNSSDGIATLKQWVTALQIPRGLLHHPVDDDGGPLDMSTFGCVYIKYMSQPSAASTDPPGSASLNGYGGDVRGVYVTADLMDGEFRQYGALPLDLYSNVSATSAESAPSASPSPKTSLSSMSTPARPGSSPSEAAVAEVLAPLMPALRELGATAEIDDVSAADGCVTLRYEGPEKLKRSIEMAIRNKFKTLQRVIFV